MALTKYQMTFQGADDDAFTTGVWSLEVDILGADVTLEHEGEEMTAWDNHKEKTVVHRRIVKVDLYPVSVLESEQDHGHYEMLMQLVRKAHVRISTTNLERIGRHFDAAGAEVGPYLLWTDTTHGLCIGGGLVVQYSGTDKAKYSGGKQVTSVEFFAAEVE